MTADGAGASRPVLPGPRADRAPSTVDGPRESSPAASVRLRIDTLVVPAASRGEGDRIAAALITELERALAGAPAPPTRVEIDRLRSPTLQWSATDRPERIGERIARAVAAALERLP